MEKPRFGFVNAAVLSFFVTLAAPGLASAQESPNPIAAETDNSYQYGIKAVDIYTILDQPFVFISPQDREKYIDLIKNGLTNKECLKLDVSDVHLESELTIPVGGVITSYFSAWHPGLDVQNGVGAEIKSAESGTISYAGWDESGFGNYVLINHGNRLLTQYGHLEKFGVKTGQKVEKGQVIGLMGSTGWSTGPHLHFGILDNYKGECNYLNPLYFIPQYRITSS